MRKQQPLTAPFNLTGHPAVRVPAGLGAGGLPLSIQLVGRAFDEATVLRVAHASERATDWHTTRPPEQAAVLDGRFSPTPRHRALAA